MLLIVLVGFALRVYNVDAMSFWADEVLTPLRSGLGVREILSNRVTLQGIVTQDTHPPLYFLIVHATRQLWGTSDLAYRMVAVLFGTITIPMMAKFGRNLFTPTIGLVTALLTTVNPLQIWYAQEARMYTLLVLCMLIASHILWRAWADPEVDRLPCWIGGYFLFAGLAVYTHYTAAFLILAQGLIWLWILWNKQLWKWVIGILVAAFLAALPLIPIVIPRLLYGVEASYFLVPPAVFFLDVVRGFGFGRTADYTIPFIYTLWILLTLVMFVGVWYAQQFRRWFLLIYLLAATVGLLAGSYIFKPMYLGPHHMMVGSPAFIVLIAVAVVKIRPKFLAPLIILIIAATQWTSLDNLYRNPNFAKDNYRDLVHYIDQQATGHDLVVYNNATLMPMQTHYSTRADVPYTTMPAYTTFATAEMQTELAATSAERIWFMSAPPQYPGDDDQLIREVLDEQFFVADRRWFHGNNTEMLISAYAPRLLGEPPVDAGSASWQTTTLPPLTAQRLTLGPATVWADLWWQLDGHEIQTFDNLHFELRAPDGGVWQQGIWTFWGMEDSAELAAQLPATTPLHTSYALSIPPALPPSTYQLWIRSDGEPDNWHNLGDVVIQDAPTPSFDTNSTLTFGNGVELVGVKLAENSVRPGNALPLVAYWHITRPQPAAPHFQLRVNGPDGLIHDELGPIFPAWFAPEAIPLNTIIAKPLGILPAPNAATGAYELQWSVLTDDAVVQGRPAWRPWQTAINQLGTFRIEPFPLVTELPAEITTVAAHDFANAVRLAGYQLEQQPDSIDLTLYWESLATIADDYWVFVHFSAEADQPPITSSNSVPVGSTRPTSGWRVGEILQDERTLTLSADLPSGDYQILLGFYHPETGQRFPVTQDGQPLPFDQLPLTTISIP